MRNFFGTLRLFFFGGIFSLIASICSIIGLFVTFIVADEHKVIIALCSFILFLIIMLLGFFKAVNAYLQKSGSTFESIATLVDYRTDDGNIIKYDVMKVLHCNHLVADTFFLEYKWTGTRAPSITSKTNAVVKVHRAASDYEKDKVELNFQTPIKLNETGIVHVNMELDDTDHKSNTHVAYKVDEKIDLLQLRVTLNHKSGAAIPNANVSRRKLGAEVNEGYTHMRAVVFDHSNRSYEETFVKPAIGYVYKLEWTR